MEARRYLSIWFRHLITDHYIRRQPAAADEVFVFAVREKNRDIISFASKAAVDAGICPGMVLSDARLLLPGLIVVPGNPDPIDLLHQIALRFIRYSPIVAVDPPDGLLLDITGCAHLWGGEVPYYQEIIHRIKAGGYDARAAIADTPGAAWAFARQLRRPLIVPPGEHQKYLPGLPPTALRLSQPILGRLHGLGLSKIRYILEQPRTTLTPRFGNQLLTRLDQAFGVIREWLVPVVPPIEHHERLPCLEPIVTATGIEYALTRLLEMLCHRLEREGKGLRSVLFQCHRVDGQIMELTVGTTRATCNIAHLFHLFSTKIPTIEPGMGIELFTLEAPVVEDAPPGQEALWRANGAVEIAELLDRISAKTGSALFTRLLPAQHHWPERSYHAVSPDQGLSGERAPGQRAPGERGFGQSLPDVQWPADPRPIHLFDPPEPITVTAPIPDYPPMSFRYRNKLYKVAAANGPTRIENEWWIDNARPRDYYTVEDEHGARYWIFRSGHYSDPDQGAGGNSGIAEKEAGGNPVMAGKETGARSGDAGDAEPVRWYLHGLFA